MRILVVEDDIELRERLKQKLARTGFSVDLAVDGDEGLFAGLHSRPDAAIVDIGLPKLSGLDVIRQWRSRQCVFPIVVLTARDRWQDKVEGITAGADDYVTKPFRFEEVAVRLQGLMRRYRGWASPDLVCGPYVLNMHNRALRVEGDSVDLTTFEYRLLEQLMLHAGKPLSMGELAEHMYGESCVASATSGQTDSAKMRDFELLRAPRRESEVDEQTRISTIHGGTEDRDPARGGSARGDGERGVSTSRAVAVGAVPLAGGGAGWFGGRAQARCAASSPKG